MPKQSFNRNQRGIVAVLAVGICLIIVTFIMWLVSMGPITLYWEALAPNMPSNTHGTMQLLNNVAGWCLALEVIGLLVWMGVHAFRKEIVDVPI